jgi:hypothetical protein
LAAGLVVVLAVMGLLLSTLSKKNVKVKDTSAYVTDPITGQTRFSDPAQRAEATNGAPVILQNSADLYTALGGRMPLMRAYVTNFLNNANTMPKNGFIYVEPGSLATTTNPQNEKEIAYKLIDQNKGKLATVVAIPTKEGGITVYFNDSKKPYQISVAVP